MVKTLRVAMAVALVAFALAGCVPDGDVYVMRFLRYESGPEGRTFAVVAPTQASEETPTGEPAWCAIEDLRPGDKVVVAPSNRSWDSPRWHPEREVLRRAE